MKKNFTNNETFHPPPFTLVVVLVASFLWLLQLNPFVRLPYPFLSSIQCTQHEWDSKKMHCSLILVEELLLHIFTNILCNWYQLLNIFFGRWQPHKLLILTFRQSLGYFVMLQFVPPHKGQNAKLHHQRCREKVKLWQAIKLHYYTIHKIVCKWAHPKTKRERVWNGLAKKALNSKAKK